MTPTSQQPQLPTPTNGELAVTLGKMQVQLTHISDGQDDLKTVFTEMRTTNDERLKVLETGHAVMVSRFANHTSHPTGGRVAELEKWSVGIDARMAAHASHHKTQSRRGTVADALAYVGVMVATFIGINNK